jgi:hypothetical protein
VLTFDRDGRRQGVTEVPPETGESRLSRGQDDRVYVEGGEGRHVLVVDDRGRARAVPPAGAGTQPSSPAPQPPPGEPTTPPVTAPARPDTADEPPARTDPPRQPPGTTSTITPQQTRKAVPASPPGLPPQVRARVSGGTIVVSWGAAAANGARVSGYRVAWAPASGGASQSVIRSGGSRSAALTGITKGVPYRITVAAQNSAGRGPAATVRATVPKPAPPRTLTVSRGETTSHEDDCLPPACAYIKVTMRGFKPNTDYDIVPHSSKHGNFNPGARLTTDSDGNLTARHRFPYSGIGDRVWVVVDGQESNRLLWTLG